MLLPPLRPGHPTHHHALTSPRQLGPPHHRPHPLVRLRRLVEPGMAGVVVKLEYCNPTGSYRDRMAVAMIEGAEKRGALRQGMQVIEYTGGSTGARRKKSGCSPARPPA